MRRILITTLFIVLLFPVISSAGKHYNGSSWVDTTRKYYNGSSWVDTTTKRWDGAQWVTLGGATTPTPIFYWPATSFTDSTAGASMVGGAGTFVSACVGNGYDMDGNGSDRDVAVPVTSSNYLNLEEGTFVACINPQAYLTTYNYIFGYGDGSNSIKLAVTNGRVLYAYLERSDTVVSVFSTTTMSEGTAYDVRITWAANGDVKIYINGALEDSDNNSATFVDVPTDTLVIGGDQTASNRFDAIIDEVYIYDQVVTP